MNRLNSTPSKLEADDPNPRHRNRLLLSDPIPDPLVELLANRLRVIGEPTRIKMLDRLEAMLRVCE